MHLIEDLWNSKECAKARGRWVVREGAVAFIQFERIFSYYYFRGLIFCPSTNRFWFASGITETLASQILYSLEVPFTCLNKSPISTFYHNQIHLKAFLPLPALSTSMMSSYFFFHHMETGGIVKSFVFNLLSSSLFPLILPLSSL